MSNNKKLPLSVVILAKNAAETLPATLLSVRFASDALLIDNGSTDATVDVAAEAGVRVVSTLEESFAKRRNIGLEKVLEPWVFYVDADEVVTEGLRNEIEEIVVNNQEGVYSVRRENYFLGTKMYPDVVERLFHVSTLQGWHGKVHESPLYAGEPVLLENPLEHHTHRDISSMLKKTNEWSEVEAQLRIDAEHPPVAWWRLVRVALSESWRQFGRLRVWQYGRAGLFESVFQVIDKLIVYTKLWERQHVQE